MPEIYRFRSIERLIEKNKELEKNEIYFASPKKLNDPMEGYIDLFWNGDSIAWENLIRHYTLCLFVKVVDYLYLRIGIKKLDVNLPSIHSINELAHNKDKEILDEIYSSNDFTKVSKNLVDIFINRNNNIRRFELAAHLSSIHTSLLDIIFNSYKKHNKDIFYGVELRDIKESTLKLMPDHVINEFEKDQFGINKPAEKLFQIFSHTNAQIALIHKFNYKDASSEEIKYLIFLMFEFTSEYVKKIESFIFPNWHTACFMHNCKDSSVWGHYGDRHTGMCLIFNTEINNKGKETIKLKKNNEDNWSRHVLHPVKYQKRYKPINFFTSIGRIPYSDLKYWYLDLNGKRSSCAKGLFSNENKWREKYWENFYPKVTTKLKSLGYEKESRIIIAPFFDEAEEGYRYSYDFNDLKGIIFGINTPENHKIKTIQIIKEKCGINKRNDFSFYQAYYSEQTGMIEHQEMRFIKFS